jgi:hypothetical protein
MTRPRRGAEKASGGLIHVYLQVAGRARVLGKKLATFAAVPVQACTSMKPEPTNREQQAQSLRSARTSASLPGTALLLDELVRVGSTRHPEST